MKSLTNSEAALLGLLSEEAMHPYKIDQEVQYRDMRFWTELSMSSIYKLLKKLEEEQLVSKENIVSPENRLQKHYSITEQGRAKLSEKLLELLSTPEHMRWQVDIALYNISLLPISQIHNALTTYKEKLIEDIKGYEDLLQFLKDSNCPPHRFEVAKRPKILLQADLDWVNAYLESLKGK